MVNKLFLKAMAEHAEDSKAGCDAPADFTCCMLTDGLLDQESENKAWEARREYRDLFELNTNEEKLWDMDPFDRREVRQTMLAFAAVIIE